MDSDAPEDQQAEAASDIAGNAAGNDADRESTGPLEALGEDEAAPGVTPSNTDQPASAAEEAGTTLEAAPDVVQQATVAEDSPSAEHPAPDADPAVAVAEPRSADAAGPAEAEKPADESAASALFESGAEELAATAPASDEVALSTVTEPASDKFASSVGTLEQPEPSTAAVEDTSAATETTADTEPHDAAVTETTTESTLTEAEMPEDGAPVETSTTPEPENVPDDATLLRPPSAAAADGEAATAASPAERALAETSSSRPTSAGAAASPSRPTSAAAAAAAAEPAEQLPAAMPSRPTSATAATGSRPASASTAAATKTDSRPSSAVAATASGSRPGSAAAAAAVAAVAATAPSSRPTSATPPAAAVTAVAATAPNSRPTSATPPATAVAAVAATAPSSRPTSAAPHPGSRPTSGTSVSAMPLQAAAATAQEADPVTAPTEPSGPYDPASFALPTGPAAALPADSVALKGILGLESYRRNGLHLLDDHVVLTAAGCTVLLVDTRTLETRKLPGLDGAGIGAVAVHPTRAFFAVAEKCTHRPPNVYVYEYPSLQLVRVLRGGTERGYAALAWEPNGEGLASVGGYPDYLLTLWAWRTEAIVLRSKAFSQDVYSLAYSPHTAGCLTTSGTGHIRFWKMASTFTGLKLQGQIGKFGNVELTDVAAFVELPDGKVVGSTESGQLLLWDGGLIKVVLTRSNGRPCHDGAVEVLLHDAASGCIVSGGADGYVRLWDFTTINEAEPDEDSSSKALQPLDELLIGPGTRIKSLLWGRRRWLVLDEAGGLVRVDLPDQGGLSKGAVITRLLDFHAGGLAGCIALPGSGSLAATAGRDGSLRVWDCKAQRVLHSAPFQGCATAFCTLPRSCDPHTTVLIAGYADGVIRVVGRAADGLRLLAAYKPHKASVTALCVSPDGTRLASTGTDGVVFYFSVKPPAEGPFALAPLAFTVLLQPAATAVWSPDNSGLLLGHRAGLLTELAAPAADVDTSRTFEVALASRTHTIQLPRPKVMRKRELPPVEEKEKEADLSASTGAASTTPPGDGTEQQPDPMAAIAEVQDVMEEVEVDDAEEASIIAAEGGALDVLTLMYEPESVGSAILLTAAGRAVGQVWRCEWGVERMSSFLPSVPTAPTTHFSYSPSGRYALLGSADGLVRVQPVERPGGPALGLHWEGRLHDVDKGYVTAITMSADESQLLSAARDGCLNLCDVSIQHEHPAPPVIAPGGSAGLLAGLPRAAADILNAAGAYTIEQEKQQAERDLLVRAAEEKKLGVREQLEAIRAEFEVLLAENNSRPEAERLPRSEFEIDPGLRQAMEEETREREAVAARELAWEVEKKSLGLAKLRAYFLGNVEVERVVLRALRASGHVATFRTAKLSEAVQAEVAAARAAAAAAAQGAQSGNDVKRQNDRTEGADTNKSSSKAAADAGAVGTDDTVPHGTARLNKADLRRLARKKREAEWAVFAATRPDDQYENPADVDAIREAEATIGDFKLKSNPNYVVPEAERMTPQRKRQQMLLLEAGMHQTRMAFNQRLLALRDVKRKVISEMAIKLDQLRDMNAALGLDEVPGLLPVMHPDEVPEQREVVSEAELDELVARRQEEEARAAGGGGLGGFSGSNAAKKAPAATTTSTPAAMAAASRVRPPSGSLVSLPVTGAAAVAGGLAPLSSGEEALRAMMAAVPQSELEKSLATLQRKRLEHNRTKILSELNALAEAFDEALGGLRRDKFKLEADLKAAEMQQLVQVQELALLREFDKREVVLLQKRQAKLDDKQEIVAKMCECNDKLELKRSELDGLVARRAAVSSDFEALVPSSDPFREPLARIFHRKIKRSKKKGGMDDEDDSDEESDGDGGEEEELDDDAGGEEICPPGCDQSLYEKVCDLREKRLDEDDAITDFSKTIEVLKKEKEALAKKQRLVDQGLAALNADIDEFQKEKQGRLNQIDVVVSLPMSAVEYLVDGRMPSDLGPGLVFSNTQLGRLKARIDELESEKAELRMRQKGLKRAHVALLRDKGAKEAKVVELEQRALDVQMLKFGQVIDLELLDRVGATQGTEELKEELRKQEQAYVRELGEWDARLTARTDELMALTRENTSALNAVSELTAAQRKLESGLTATRKGMFLDPVQQRRAEVEERDNLVQLVNSQAGDIERLKAQIAALRNKDTSVYS